MEGGVKDWDSYELAEKYPRWASAICSKPLARQNLRKGEPGTTMFDPQVYVKMNGSQAAGAPSSPMGVDRSN